MAQPMGPDHATKVRSFTFTWRAELLKHPPIVHPSSPIGSWQPSLLSCHHAVSRAM